MTYTGNPHFHTGKYHAATGVPCQYKKDGTFAAHDYRSGFSDGLVTLAAAHAGDYNQDLDARQKKFSDELKRLKTATGYDPS
jgi:hypothetical protein